MMSFENRDEKISLSDRFESDTKSSLFCYEVSKYGIDTALAEEHIALGNYEEAIKLAKDAILIAQHTGETESIYEAYAQGILADALFRMGSYQQAAEKYREALKTYEHNFISPKGPEMIELLGAAQLMAFTMVNTNEFEDAVKACLVALGMTEKTLGPTTIDAAEAMINLATAYVNNGDIDEAPEALYKRALEINSKALSNPTLYEDSSTSIASITSESIKQKVALCYMALGDLYYKRNNDDMAKEYYLNLEEMANNKEISMIEFYSGLKNLALIFWRKGNSTQSYNLLTTLLKSMEASPKYGLMHEETNKLRLLFKNLMNLVPPMT
eukprot:gene12872-17250_t